MISSPDWRKRNASRCTCTMPPTVVLSAPATVPPVTMRSLSMCPPGSIVTGPLTTITLPCTRPAIVSGPHNTATLPGTESLAATDVGPVFLTAATALNRYAISAASS